MGKVGSIFRDARLGKGLTLDQVADETNISKRFLQGIENDNYTGFPGEVYALGFIRNYAEFLGLDTKRMIEIYHSVEEPAPTSESSEPQETQEIKDSEPKHDAELGPSLIPEPPQEGAQPQTPSLFPEADMVSSPEKPPAQNTSASPKKLRKKPEKKIPAVAADTSEAPTRSQEEIPTPNPLHHIEGSIEKESIAKEKKPNILLGRLIPLALVAIVIIIAVLSILPTLKIHTTASRHANEFRAEGLPFEQRLYPHDKVFLPLGNDFVAVTLLSIKDKVIFDTPYGSLSAGLNQDIVINPSSENERLVASILDYAPNKPQNGADVRFDAKDALSSDQQSDITIAAGTPKNQDTLASAPQNTPTQSTQEVLFKSSGGAHPFYVNINFMAPVLFRYEADKKEWIEKYYRKGESITVNASNTITFWTANAQAVKVNVFQSAGKSTELVMGGAGEIAVKRLFWSNAQGGWALVAEALD